MNIKQLKKTHSVAAIASAAGVNPSQVYNWLSENRELLELKEGGWVINSTKVIKIKPIEE